VTDQPENLLKLKKDQIKPASKMLARAFRDEPMNRYAFPELGGSDPRVPYGYEFLLRLGTKYGHTYTTSPALEGVAVWMRITTPYMSIWRMLFSGALVSGMKIGLEAGQRMQEISRHLDKRHEEMIHELHWYLQLIGVDPEHQGKGFASRLIRGMLARIDGEGLPCYLETELEENVPIYQHFGFQVLEEYYFPDTPLKMWLMLRPASPGTGK
jgi:ribosomal protein S18 acetylase RimI-like enzyme